MKRRKKYSTVPKRKCSFRWLAPLEQTGSDRLLQFENLLPLVTAIAYNIKSKMSPDLARVVDIDDLKSCGAVGLWIALGSYDSSRRSSIQTWARVKIRGAMFDEIRHLDHLSRSLRARLKSIEKDRKDLEETLGKEIEFADVADGCSSNAEIQAVLSNNGYHHVSIDGMNDHEGSKPLAETLADKFAIHPLQYLQREELFSLVRDTVEDLHERLRFPVVQYYWHDRRMREIGAELAVTESRVCQMLGTARALIRVRVLQVLPDPDFLLHS